MNNWTIKAYQMVDGKNTLVEWASGFSHKHAKAYFKCLRDTNEFSMLEMKKVEINC